MITFASVMKQRQFILFALALLHVLAADISAGVREFRGAWLHTVFQEGYGSRSTEQNKAYLRTQLDRLKSAGMNVVIFQVRPQSDAFYKSDIEPWSRFLTAGGKAPVPFWDPLEFMIEECHARGMELHAWMNPYRVTSTAKQTLPKNHIYHKHPERFVRYDGKLYFDPGQPENRKFICRVVDDIVRRYDVDGIHFDDYFYPYPVRGKKFPDEESFRKYGKGMPLADWRRQNVNLLIEEVHGCIASVKPWVRFGVSPFGIWRNIKNDKRGSRTNGLQNYDDLYADVLLWEDKGWVDYLLPQIYWNFGNPSAAYEELVDWWNSNAGTKRHLYVGQDVGRTMKAQDKTQLRRKIELARSRNNVAGNCWWPGYEVTANSGGVADSLASSFQSRPALVPSYPWISDSVPDPVEKLKVKGRTISWSAAVAKQSADDVVRYAVYRFENIESAEDDSAAELVDVVYAPSFKAERPGVYAVAALSRVNNESELSNPVIVK